MMASFGAAGAQRTVLSGSTELLFSNSPEVIISENELADLLRYIDTIMDGPQRLLDPATPHILVPSKIGSPF